MVGERGEQLDLFVSKRSRFGTGQCQYSDRKTFAQERDAERCSIVAKDVKKKSVFRIGEYVRDLDWPAFQRGSADD